MITNPIIPSGYDREEEFFHRQNQLLLEHLRQTLGEDKVLEASAPPTPLFRSGCPECGGDLESGDILGIRMKRCGACECVCVEGQALQAMLDAAAKHNLDQEKGRSAPHLRVAG